MHEFDVNKELFNFKYLPPFAGFLLANKLEEFAMVGIRFARQYDLPMMKPLSRIPEKELLKVSLQSNKELLEAISNNSIADHIERNAKRWLDNKLGIVDQAEVTAEDLTLAFFIRRKTFANFLYEYSPNPTIHQLITEEVDTYTTQEELINLKVYLHLHKKELH